MMLRRLTSLEIILLTGVGLITCAVIPLPMSEFSGIITEIDPQPPAHAIYPLIQRKRRDTGEHKEAASAGFAALLSVTGEFMVSKPTDKSVFVKYFLLNSFSISPVVVL